MHRTGIEDSFIVRGGRKMRCGYTTGTCAAAAACAAAQMLLDGTVVPEIEIRTPKGVTLSLEVEDVRTGDSFVSCGVRKFAGDDPDVTDGLLIVAEVSAIPSGIEIDGGEGVGRAVREGLQVRPGEAAINPVPRRMIREGLEKLLSERGVAGGLRVVISVPGGREAAEKTFNPRLGIEGGISILGTTGIVTPMSDSALIGTIGAELSVRRAQGQTDLLVVPGNYGEAFARDVLGIPAERAVRCSNFVGETIDAAAGLGFRGLLFAAHIGKFIKVAGGIMNTHSRCADARAELMAAFALRAGADRELALRILDTVTTDEALSLMQAAGILEPAMNLAAEKVRMYLQQRAGGALETEAVLFSTSFGYLAQTAGAPDLLARLKETPGTA